MAEPTPGGTSLSLVPRPGNLHLSEHVPTREAVRALSPRGQQPRDVSLMLAEARKHVLGVEIVKIKAAVAESAVGELAEHTASVFDNAAGRILDRKALQRSGEHQHFYNEFSTLLTQVLARDLVQIHTAGTASIRQEVERPTYVEHQERSFLDRLLGRE
jgi:hypothetical protein